jgi:hypothetical protein
MKPLDVPSHWAPNFAIIAFMVVMSAVIFAWMYSAFLAPSDKIATPPGTSAVVAASPTSGNQQGLIGSPTGESIGAAAIASPTSTPTTQPTATPTPTQAPTPTVAPTEAPTQAPTVEPTATPSGTHEFAFTATSSVWVQATVDGVVRFSAVLPGGASRAFQGKTMTLESGNAPFIVVSVDGVQQGLLGNTWDATKTYPSGD